MAIKSHVQTNNGLPRRLCSLPWEIWHLLYFSRAITLILYRQEQLHWNVLQWVHSNQTNLDSGNGKTVLRCTLEWYIGDFLCWIIHWTFVDVGWDRVYRNVFFYPLDVMEDCDRCILSISFLHLKAARYLSNIRTNCSLRGNKVEMEDVCDFTSDSCSFKVHVYMRDSPQRLVLRSSACQNLQRQVWNQVLWKSLWNPPL